MKKLVLGFCILCLSSHTHAGFTTSTIKHILFYEGGNMIYVYPSTPIQGAPACHNPASNGDYYTFKMDRPMAKQYLAGLMAAQVAGLVVGFKGKGACVDQSFVETLDYFTVTK